MLYIVLRADGDFGPDFCFSGLEGDLEVELVVDGCLLGGPGVADDVAQVAEGGGALGFDLAGPFGDGLGVASGVESGLVAGEAGVAVGDGGPGVRGWRGGLGGGGCGLGCLHLGDGAGEPAGREDDSEP